MKNKISIAMTTYNGEKYVLEQLASLLNQTRTIDEVIIIDDNSSDNTASIVREFIRIKELKNWYLFTNFINVGFIKNFYNAIEKTTGDIIFLCDQDDVWEPFKVETMEKVMALNPLIEVLNTAILLVDENNNCILNHNKSSKSANFNFIKESYQESELVKFDIENILYKNISPGCTICFKKEIKLLLSKQKNTITPHDWVINILGASKDGLYFLNNKLTRYRIHSNNTIGITKRGYPSIEKRRKSANIQMMDFIARLQLAKDVCLNYNETKSLKFLNFYQRRYNFLYQRKFMDFLYLIYNKNDYYSKRTMLGDFMYLIHAENLTKTFKLILNK